MFGDKITTKGEIENAGVFEIKDDVFLLFVYPITNQQDTCVLVNSMLAHDEKEGDFPLIIGSWNPVVFKKVNITEELLQSYRFFWGKEYN